MAASLVDLVVRGGTVVTPAGSFGADLAVDGGRISADRAGPVAGWRASAPRGRRRRRACSSCPGVDRRPHPHAGRLGRRAGPLLPGFGRGGVRWDDDVPGLQQPGHGLVAGRRAVARRRAGRVARGDGVGRRRRLRGQPGDQRPDGRPGRRAAGDRRRGRADGQGVHGLRLPARRSAPVRRDPDDGPARRAARGPLRGSRPDRHGASPTRWPGATTAPRFHASSRPALAEAIATARVDGLRRGRRRAGPRRPPLVRRCAGGGPGRPGCAACACSAETCPHYLALTDARYLDPDDAEVAKVVISPPLRPPPTSDALWAGLADGALDLDRHRPCPGPGRRREADAGRVRSTRSATARRGSRRSWRSPGPRAWRRAGSAAERHGRAAVRRAGPAVRARAQGRPRAGPRRGPRPVRSGGATDAARRRPPPHPRLHRRSRASRSAGAVRSVFVRGRAVIRDGVFVGQRGFGRSSSAGSATEARGRSVPARPGVTCPGSAGLLEPPCRSPGSRRTPVFSRVSGAGWRLVAHPRADELGSDACLSSTRRARRGGSKCVARDRVEQRRSEVGVERAPSRRPGSVISSTRTASFSKITLWWSGAAMGPSCSSMPGSLAAARCPVASFRVDLHQLNTSDQSAWADGLSPAPNAGSRRSAGSRPIRGSSCRFRAARPTDRSLASRAGRRHAGATAGQLGVAPAGVASEEHNRPDRAPATSIPCASEHSLGRESRLRSGRIPAQLGTRE